MDSESINVTFAAGDTSAPFDVLINGGISEDTGATNFTLIINSSSLPSNVNVGDPHQTTVIIMDKCKHKMCDEVANHFCIIRWSSYPYVN